jgi:dihydroflavonol-4-reductase
MSSIASAATHPVQPGDRVAVTGAAGFIGSAITRCLLDRGAAVTALIEPGGDEGNLDGLGVERRTVDIRDHDAVLAALDGTRYVFHTAAIYSFWASDPGVFSAVNVQGTRNVLEAATRAGCERVVYTSTVGTVGLDRTRAGQPADEECPADIGHLFGLYKRTKYVAEHEVLRAAAQGAQVVLVLPTFPLGPRDTRPTPTGQLVLDFLNGKIPGYVDTSLNVAHVDDLAQAHVLALEHGRSGRSYIAGGENLAMADLLRILANVTGLPAPTRQFPRALALAAGAVSETIQGRLLNRQPFVSMEAARMSTTTMIFNDARARTELGYTSRPAIEAITDSARWFVENGYVKKSRRDGITWPDVAGSARR